MNYANTMKFTKGHGTGNDFVLLFDPFNEIEISPTQVARICDRSFGIGADGLIRIGKQDGYWFMDYRNSDGSLAQICGNGIRVMARYLKSNHQVLKSDVQILTRGGLTQVSFNQDDSISVELGPVQDLNQEITVTVSDTDWVGAYWSAPNPHVISVVQDLEQIGSLFKCPDYEPTDVLGEGANFEFVRIIDPQNVQVRVFERGVGETLSCGSGACAVAAFVQKHHQGANPLNVELPGGTLIIESLDNNMVRLTGPAVLVAQGQLDELWTESK